MHRNKKPERPDREPDHYSKRDVPYWWAPNWVRGTGADEFRVSNINGERVVMNYTHGYGKIKAIKEKGDVNLYMLSQDGNYTFIRGSIQEEFKKWHLDRSIDYILFGEDPDDIIK